jgi:hypothetical protein
MSITPEMIKGLENSIDRGNRSKAKKERLGFWLPVGISIIALIIAGISLWLQVKDRLKQGQQQPTTQSASPVVQK